MSTGLFTLRDWRLAYLDQGAAPRDLIIPLLARLSADDPAWILRCDQAFVEAQLQRLDAVDRSRAPLYGVPFAVKDNIDVAGLPTTAACPAFAYTAARHATVVQRLIDAGAVLVGKTNLDQFATGLVGTRSPYGAVPNSFDPAYISGGSSSGSASVVARGLVPFALGTDTAGSGRVPAGLNNIVGLKPTPGRVPMQGVVPACRTLDVVSVLALTVADAAQVMALIEGGLEGGLDDTPAEPSFQSHALRPAWLGRLGTPLRVGLPARPDCDAALGFDMAWDAAVAQLSSADGGAGAGIGAGIGAGVGVGVELQPIDMAPLYQVARLLYDGPWVAERCATVRSLIDDQPEALDPVVRRVISAGREYDALSAFDARYQLEDLRQRIAPMWRDIDVLMLPTVPTCPTLAAVSAEPVLRNSELGRFTNFVNLLGLAALAVPAGWSSSGLPFGVTFVAPGGSDAALAELGARWQAAHALSLGCRLRPPLAAELQLLARPAAAPTLQIAVVGAHLEGQPLHEQLVERGCRLVERTTTAEHYRLYALPVDITKASPPKPGLVLVDAAGVRIALEVYEMPLDAVGSFLALIPPPLGLGSVQLAGGAGHEEQDGRWVKGFICEPSALTGATDISAFRGWRTYIAKR